MYLSNLSMKSPPSHLLEQEVCEKPVSLTNTEVIEQRLSDFAGVLEEAEDGHKHLDYVQR